jgi:hypothetical protein
VGVGKWNGQRDNRHINKYGGRKRNIALKQQASKIKAARYSVNFT